uniref:Uncharacterized protein n=1 Tax=Lepeophtheirus salmonis TaxID=72036 RepID=A0A0K2V6D3_LEPSM
MRRILVKIKNQTQQIEIAKVPLCAMKTESFLATMIPHLQTDPWDEDLRKYVAKNIRNIFLID